MEHLMGASSGQRSSGLGVVAAAGLTGKTRAGGDTNLDMEVSMSAALAVRLPVMDPESRAWVAVQAADDAVMGVLARLADFRGLSRFTTWAYKFALLEAATRARRMAWRDRELPRPPEDWLALAAPDGHPEATAEHAELLAAVRTAVAEVLTPHQREVLLTVVAGRVPLDVLAERRGTTRGALYKTIHDARRKLRHHLAANGLLAGRR
jgi:RNA polymerase sigma-70 factor, ECF subfamily